MSVSGRVKESLKCHPSTEAVKLHFLWGIFKVGLGNDSPFARQFTHSCWVSRILEDVWIHSPGYFRGISVKCQSPLWSHETGEILLFSHRGYKVDGVSAYGLGQGWNHPVILKDQLRVDWKLDECVNWAQLSWTHHGHENRFLSFRKSHWKTLHHKEDHNNRCLVMTDWCFLHLRGMGCTKDNKKEKECFFFNRNAAVKARGSGRAVFHSAWPHAPEFPSAGSFVSLH